MTEETKPEVAASAGLIAGHAFELGGVKMKTLYQVECVGSDGVVKWREEFHNVVTTVGKNKLLDATFKTGLAAPAWYIGLKGTGTAVAGDTMASHAAWTEDQNYSNATRVAFTPGVIAAGSVDNTAAVAAFNINATTTIFGCFLNDVSTKGGGTGTLYGAGDFAASRAVLSGDTLNVTMTLTAA